MVILPDRHDPLGSPTPARGLPFRRRHKLLVPVASVGEVDFMLELVVPRLVVTSATRPYV